MIFFFSTKISNLNGWFKCTYEMPADPERLGAARDMLVIHKPAVYIFRKPVAEELLHGHHVTLLQSALPIGCGIFHRPALG